MAAIVRRPSAISRSDVHSLHGNPSLDLGEPISAMPTFLITLALAAAFAAAARGAPPEFQNREQTTAAGERLPYVVYIPHALDPAKPIPLLLFLHGSCAECVTHERILRESNLQFWHGYDRDRQLEPTILVAPAGGRGGWTSEDRRQAVFAIVDSLMREFPVDAKRIYLQGFSMGAAGAWNYLQTRPGFFAAANPQAFPARELDVEPVRHTPVWATIGADDPRSAAMAGTVAALRAANGDHRGALPSVTGVNPRFSIFQGVGHGGAQAETQRLPGFREWMYAQRNDGNTAPNVRFVTPAFGSSSGSALEAVAVATDREGQLDRVEFLLEERLVHVDRDPPYEFTFRGLPAGVNTLRVRAVDKGGKSATGTVTVTTTPD
ncbi:MAG: hypothetical protein R2762_21820 [Bryobacteraceae bacterium]